jgi:Na+/proline symporter
MTSNIDIIIFIAFLVTNLVVGLAYGREVKTISDYSLGGRNFSHQH